MTRILWIAVAALAISGSPRAAPLPDPPATGLEIELTCTNPVVTPAIDPGFTAHLVNKGKKPVTVVLPGDGSEVGWRTPVVRWGKEERGTIRRCGNINRLKPDEVVELAPGERVKLGWVGHPTLDSGTNKVKLELEHIPTLKWRGLPLGKHDEATMKKVQALPAFKLTSNVVEVQVREK
jgi:hypothetical protein